MLTKLRKYSHPSCSCLALTDKLGFETRTDISYGEGSRWVEVAPPGADTTVALVPPRGPEDLQPGSDMQLGFTTASIEADYAELSARGVEFDGEIMRMGDPVPPMIFFRDQDGNRILLLERH